VAPAFGTSACLQALSSVYEELVLLAVAWPCSYCWSKERKRLSDTEFFLLCAKKNVCKRRKRL
jgi:hypothetical protein